MVVLVLHLLYVLNNSRYKHVKKPVCFRGADTKIVSPLDGAKININPIYSLCVLHVRTYLEKGVLSIYSFSKMQV